MPQLARQAGRRAGEVMTTGSPRRALVIALKHIGDVLVATPALRALKEHWPQTEIELLVNAGMGELVRGLPSISVLHEIDRSALRGRPFAELAFVRELRARQYDVAVDLTGGERSAWYAFLSGAEVRVGVDEKRAFPGRRLLFNSLTPWGEGHYAENFLNILAPLGVIGKPGKIEIAIPESARQEVTELLKTGENRRKILIHPVSRWMFKSWPAKSCAETIIKINKNTTTVYLSAGKSVIEQQRTNEVLALLPEEVRKNVVDCSGKLTLAGLAALISGCNLFMGVDSAPMHIASACGTPAVVLFGPSGEHNWGPWRNEHRVITSLKPCRPCGRDGCAGTKRSQCMESITAQQVIAAASELLPTSFA